MQDLTGLKFNRWTVVSFSYKDKHGHNMWLCKCICGNEKIIASDNLKSNKSKSCGCLRVETCREIGHLKTISWNKGMKGVFSHSSATKNKISKAFKGENHWNWMGGITDNPYSDDWTETLRVAIRQRDNYTCQICGIKQSELNGRFKKLDVHHIDYDKQNCSPVNLISLCHLCHVKTNINRDYWIGFFAKYLADVKVYAA